MSAPTGIAVSEELSSVFASAIESQNVRFLKISIRNESLVPDESIPPSGTLEQDLDRLNSIVDDDIPAYVLVRLDDPPSEWLAIYYVPETAKVRDKMLYAATRTALTKSLGAAHFPDSIFATSKDDLSANAYAKHKQHLAAPKPMSAREKEIEAVKAAERQAGGYTYEGSNARRSHVASGVGFQWSHEADSAIKELASGLGISLVVLRIDASSETITLSSTKDCPVEQLGSSLPTSEPSYAFFALPQSLTSSQRELVFIYSCPSSSPVKNRMLYSSGFISTCLDAKKILELAGSVATITARKIETSDPSELDEKYLAVELGRDGVAAASAAAPVVQDEKKAFARPKGPGRKR
ncbi:actin depolymerizing protein [Fomitopsis serialis]|uniref:actin depolymerizing protein n=1 Tax=Fomitopsis serialis TaxID=139415 RepID=UPI002008D23C|nr:actin depolymerizing protein [Neoantrodia serialis]KAH9934699.1 actin depolymerizing protein [Neoantrodia serialis]